MQSIFYTCAITVPMEWLREKNETNKNRQEFNFCIFLLSFQISTVPQHHCSCHYNYLSEQGGCTLWALSSRSFVISAPISQWERRLKCHSLLQWILPCTYARMQTHTHLHIHIQRPSSNPNIMSALSAYFCGPAKTKVLTLEEWGGVYIAFCVLYVCVRMYYSRNPTNLWTHLESESVKQLWDC